MVNLLWGVKGVFYDKLLSTEETIKDINRIAFEKNYTKEQDFIVNVTSMPASERGMANTIRLTQYTSNAK